MAPHDYEDIPRPDDDVPVHTTRGGFRRGVREAAQEVAAVHRWRVFWSGFAGGIAVALLLALPTTFLIGHANCASIGRLAEAVESEAKESTAVRNRFLAESSDRFGLTPTQFEEALKRNDEAQARRVHAFEDVRHTDCTFR